MLVFNFCLCVQRCKTLSKCRFVEKTFLYQLDIHQDVPNLNDHSFRPFFRFDISMLNKKIISRLLKERIILLFVDAMPTADVWV
jgi:hypothetical protein